jgi:hypothetical protein
MGREALVNFIENDVHLLGAEVCDDVIDIKVFTFIRCLSTLPHSIENLHPKDQVFACYLDFVCRVACKEGGIVNRHPDYIGKELGTIYDIVCKFEGIA